MPELAEIETSKNYLGPNIIGEEIKSYDQYRANLRYIIPSYVCEQASSGRVEDVTRRAKFLSIKLSNGCTVIFHLGMSGRLTVKERNYQTQKHDHIIISFKSGKKLVFNDARRFGMIYSCKSEELDAQEFLKNMGQEPLNDDFNTEYLISLLGNKTSPIKTALMDNRIVVGVGNIYAAESLFSAKIHPQRPAKSLTKIEVARIVASIKQVLEKAIKAGGTTLKDFVGGDSKPGYFKQELNVYGRANEKCHICMESIQKIQQAGRSSFFCPLCQQ
ncbi:bifunctional DNA-formamidopyrimidine glycosylase/DNA-(apurinic or apyrimidinic site) lyase [Rickettsiaceae bacterium]|nr:bifunctional DNA-formamidopyrimidine glycosylase/DNA-(apurinic or apyrimidinic site) lyase [Rickettsiaceae bacterium]